MTMPIRPLARATALAAAVLLLAGCDRPSGDVSARGAELAQEKGCVACHGLNGKGTGPTFPDINGQWASYMRTQLLKYRSGERQNAIMNGQASALSDSDIAILSKYYAAQ
jgi:cytochrome c553